MRLEHVVRLSAKEKGHLSLQEAAALIRSDRVRVDAQVVSEPSHQVLIPAEEVTLDGVRLDPARAFQRLLLFNKPSGVVCEGASSSERSIFRLLTDHQRHHTLSFFGRLDKDTTGLMLLGTDGGIGALLTDPDSGISKEYWAALSGIRPLHPDAAQRIAAGLELADGSYCLPATLQIVHRPPDRALQTTLPSPPVEMEAAQAVGQPVVCLTLHEGRNHQVKRMLGACDGHVVKLHREAIGPLRLSELRIAQGTARVPNEQELKLILSMLPASRDAKARSELIQRRLRGKGLNQIEIEIQK